MISDTLSDSIASIKSYQERMPEIYDCDRDRINAVVEKMEELRIYFDSQESPEWIQLKTENRKSYICAHCKCTFLEFPELIESISDDLKWCGQCDEKTQNIVSANL